MLKIKDQINLKKLPKHIAIIMDGNGRWAKEKGFARLKGHEKGSASARTVTEVSSQLGIKVLTLYAFSSENWKRPKKEIFGLMKLLKHFLKTERETLVKNNIQLKVMGRLDKLSKLLVREIEKVKEATKDNTGMVLNIALSYGSREEIVEAAQKIINSRTKKVTEEVFSKFLYTSDLPDPDLLIRSSGEMRLSNFLLWQCAYTEFYFTDTYWPDFSEKELYKAVLNFQSRGRRYGLTH